ncbi:MAG: hypothetical protein FD151_1822 [bacterium]|nr:MAG: hypothetical protein FD151_1822 [bacterium]
MLAITSALQAQFEGCLRNKEFPNSLQRGVQKVVEVLPGLLSEVSFP